MSIHKPKSLTLLFSFALALVLAFAGIVLYSLALPSGEYAAGGAEPQNLSAFFWRTQAVPIIPDRPKRLVIPAIGVRALVQEVGVDQKGQMGIPTNFTDVAWFKLGPKPGEPGTAVIDGHLDTVRDANAVFANLSKLKKGDIIKVEDFSGQTINFQVTETATYDITNAPVDKIFEYNTNVSKLNLITCDGIWNQKERNYNQRFVVYSTMVTDTN